MEGRLASPPDFIEEKEDPGFPMAPAAAMSSVDVDVPEDDMELAPTRRSLLLDEPRSQGSSIFCGGALELAALSISGGSFVLAVPRISGGVRW